MLGDGKSPYYLKKFTNALVQSSLFRKKGSSDDRNRASLNRLSTSPITKEGHIMMRRQPIYSLILGAIVAAFAVLTLSHSAKAQQGPRQCTTIKADVVALDQ